MNGLGEHVASLAGVTVYLFNFEESGVILTSISRLASRDMNYLKAL